MNNGASIVPWSSLVKVQPTDWGLDGFNELEEASREQYDSEDTTCRGLVPSSLDLESSSSDPANNSTTNLIFWAFFSFCYPYPAPFLDEWISVG